ncbi:peptidoglycan hydrolase, partial [Granulicatella balaenopterae]
YAGTTENLYKEKGYLFKEIDARDIRRGDVFIVGNEGYSLGEAGHTGIAYNDNSILHCTLTDELDGIHLTLMKGWVDDPGYPVRWFRIVNQ